MALPAQVTTARFTPAKLARTPAVRDDRAGGFYDPRVTISAHDSLVLFALLVAGTTLLVLAPILRIPYPILLVLGGLGIGFIPGIPHFALRPDIVLVGFLPPLLYSGAFFTSLRDLRTNARADLAAVGRPRARDDAHGRRGLPRHDRRAVVAGLLRDRRDRRARPTPSPRPRSARASACRAGS